METNQQDFNVHPGPRWIFAGVGGLLMIFLALLIVQKANDIITSFKNTKPANTISVSGEGKVTATPDLATIDMGVTTQGSTAADVSGKNNAAVNKVIAFLKSQGVAAADISTSGINLYPQSSFPSYPPQVPGGSIPTITGYAADQTVTVKVHGVDKSQTQLDNILDGAVSAGANEINDVNLSIENPDALQQQAQTMAIANAKQKAQALAQAAGLTLGKVVGVSDNSSPIQPLPFALNAAMGSAGGQAAVAPNIQPGSQEIDETMTVTFEVK